MLSSNLLAIQEIFPWKLTCSAHCILLDFIIIRIPCDVCESWSLLYIVTYWGFYSRWIIISTQKLNTLQLNTTSNSPNTAGQSLVWLSVHSHTMSPYKRSRSSTMSHALTMSTIHFNHCEMPQYHKLLIYSSFLDPINFVSNFFQTLLVYVLSSYPHSKTAGKMIYYFVYLVFKILEGIQDATNFWT
jgi:hypothetical protein